jgi:predicted ATPase
MHVGEAQPRAGDFYGPSVNRAARIMAAAHGGQVLLSEIAAGLAGDRLPPGAGLRDLGAHRLKDLMKPERMFQLLHPLLPSDFPPLATLSEQPNNLPTQTSDFVGREEQLGAVQELLETAGVRLLTLTGPGGIGKTRLALQGAADQIHRFDDGVYFVDLSAIRDADAAFEAIVRAIGLTRTSDEQLLDVLNQQLRSRHMLLLLDNFEQVMDAADGIADLLQHCHKLKVLVTSREALRIRGERLFPVPSLSLPDGRLVQLSADVVAGYEAVRLFVERAREARPNFTLTDGNAGAVAEICARLDGLPLAIELAAARLKLFSPEDLLDRLRSRLDVLRGGARDLPARQQTLRSTIEWSYELLDDEERAMFQLLSVFSSAQVHAVEEVVLHIESLRNVDVVDRLGSLVDKSLVRSLEGLDGQRLSMLETIREYAAERLGKESGLNAAACRAHAEYFSDFAQSVRDHLSGPRREGTLNDLASELGNLQTAWRFWVGVGDLDQLNRLLESLWALHDARGWYYAAVELTNDLLAVLSTMPSTPERAREEITLRTSLARGLLALRGYTDEVEEIYGRALSLSEEAGELPQRFQVLRSLASFYQYRAEFDKAMAIGHELLDLAEQEADPGIAVHGHLLLGASLGVTGDVANGLHHLDRAIALFDPHQQGAGPLRFGPSPGVVSFTTSALLLWLNGYADQAAKRAAGGLELAKKLNHPYTLAYALFHVGLLDVWGHELEAAFEQASRLLEVADEHDYQVWRALGHILRGVAMVGLTQVEEGLATIDRGMAEYEGSRTPPVFWPLVLSLRATGCVWGGRADDGLAILDEAIQLSGEGLFVYPEFALLKGDILLAGSKAADAEAWFNRAFDVALERGHRTTQVRAATRLTRLLRESGRTPDGTDALRGAYEALTEGFSTPAAVEARAVLDQVDTQAS